MWKLGEILRGANKTFTALNKAAKVDIRPEQQKTIEKVMKAGTDKYGTPEAYNGHSRGGIIDDCLGTDLMVHLRE